MKKKLTFLVIETSCDETAAAIVQENGDSTANVLSNIVSSQIKEHKNCLLYTSPSPRDRTRSRMPSSA